MFPSQTLDSICQDQCGDWMISDLQKGGWTMLWFDIWIYLKNAVLKWYFSDFVAIGDRGTVWYRPGKASQQQLQRDQDNYHSDQDGGRSWDGSLASKPMLCVHCALQLLFFPTGGDKTSTIALQSGSKDIFCCIILILSWWRWRERGRERILILIKIPLERSRFWGCTLYIFVFRSGWLDLYLQSQKSRMYNMDDCVLILWVFYPLSTSSRKCLQTRNTCTPVFATINQEVSLVTSFKLHVISTTEGGEIDSLPLKIQDIQIQLSVQGKACHEVFFFGLQYVVP